MIPTLLQPKLIIVKEKAAQIQGVPNPKTKGVWRREGSGTYKEILEGFLWTIKPWGGKIWWLWQALLSEVDNLLPKTKHASTFYNKVELKLDNISDLIGMKPHHLERTYLWGNVREVALNIHS